MVEKKVKKEEKARKEKEVGKIIHFFDKISVGVVKATKATIKAGDKIHVKGMTTDFDQAADSLQIEHKNVKEIKKGEEAGMKVKERVREGDKIYKIEE